MYPIVSYWSSELILTRITTKWSQQTILLLRLCMIKVTNTTLYSAFDNSFNFGCTMKLCNFLEIRIHILLKCNVQGRILCRPWEYSSPNQSDILDYSASNVSNTFLYFTHFWRCESKHFAAKIGSSWFKSNLSLVCQVICQNTSGMVYVLYYSWSNTPSFIITRLPLMHNSNPLASWKLSTECPIWKEHYFEAVYRAEFSTHFVGTYRKLKPKDVQIDW